MIDLRDVGALFDSLREGWRDRGIDMEPLTWSRTGIFLARLTTDLDDGAEPRSVGFQFKFADRTGSVVAYRHGMLEIRWDPNFAWLDREIVDRGGNSATICVADIPDVANVLHKLSDRISRAG